MIVLNVSLNDTESLLRLKTTIPNLSYVKKRQYGTFLILNTEQKRQYRRKNRKGFRRFWLEKTDNTDNFVHLKTEYFSTREPPPQLSGHITYTSSMLICYMTGGGGVRTPPAKNFTTEKLIFSQWNKVFCLSFTSLRDFSCDTLTGET